MTKDKKSGKSDIKEHYTATYDIHWFRACRSVAAICFAIGFLVGGFVSAIIVHSIHPRLHDHRLLVKYHEGKNLSAMEYPHDLQKRSIIRQYVAESPDFQKASTKREVKASEKAAPPFTL